MAATLIGCGFAASPASAGYVVTLNQVGSDVIATGGGPLDLTGLTFREPTSLGDFNNPGIIPVDGVIVTGAGGKMDVYTGFSGPPSFGSGGATRGTIPFSSTGDLVGISPLFNNNLFVPAGYLSNNPLSDVATYSGKTFSSLGVAPGTYEWSWGTGLNQNFTLQIVPESSTWILLLLGLTILFGPDALSSLRNRCAAFLDRARCLIDQSPLRSSGSINLNRRI
ncbi:MAG: PEP-CTERM sorting domain-containing protein [Chthoniobacterales bacterium]